MAALLEVKGLKAYYGQTQALHDVSFELEEGGITTLLGANGAGKTTTINLFLNFTTPTGGVARVGGLDVTARPLETKRLLAYIPEQVTLYRTLTGLENLRFFSHLGAANPPGDEALRGYLSQAGLDAAAGR